MKYLRSRGVLWACYACVMSYTSEASVVESIPDPLTLEYVLQHVQEDHPVLVLARANIAAANAALLEVDATQTWDIYMQAYGGWSQRDDIEQSASLHNDSRLSLILERNLYDFGFSAAKREAVASLVRGAQLQYLSSYINFKRELIVKYTEVILSDMTNQLAEEVFAIAFVRHERAQEAHRLGQISDIELLKKNSIVQQARAKRGISQAKQKNTRVVLAEAMRRPDDLAASLQEPEFNIYALGLPLLDTLYREGMQKNTGLLVIESRLEGLQANLLAIRRSDNPRLDIEIGGNKYVDPLRSDEEWSAAVVVNIPLVKKGRDARLSLLHVKIARLRAERERMEILVRQKILDIWQHINILTAQRESLQVEFDYLDLELDKHRFLYERDMQADLGDGMVNLYEIRMKSAMNRYQYINAWAVLAMLTGNMNYMPVVKNDD